MKPRALFFCALFLSGFFPPPAGAEPGRFFRSLPVQHQGRVKPFDTLSREVLREINGRETYKKRSAADVILSWTLVPDYWNKTAFILAEGRELKEALGLPLKQRRFAPEDFFFNKRFREELEELNGLRVRGEKPDGFYQNLQNLERRLILYESAKTGLLLKFQPPALAAETEAKTAPLKSKKSGGDLKPEPTQVGAAESGGASDKAAAASPDKTAQNPAAEQWISLRDMKGKPAAAFQKALSVYVRLISQQVSGANAGGGSPATTDRGASGEGETAALKPAELKTKDLQTAGKKDKKSPAPSSANSAVRSLKTSAETATESKAAADPEARLQNEQELAAALQKFKQEVFKDKAALYFSERKIQAELFYNSLNPFFWSWILYLAFLCLWAAVKQAGGGRKAFWSIVPILAAAFSLHTLGAALRSFIMSRPPVSNMYETFLWVPWIAVIAGFVFYLKKSAAPFAAAIGTAALCLFTASAGGAALGESLQPLQAVLRSNFWLSSHVLIITMSYSFFFIAFVLGDAALILYLFQGKKADKFIQSAGRSLYRLVQWGTASLAVGTILGAIWADYSWGRFWGWDPKESWALITLLGYVALLHRKASGKLSAFGMASASVGLFFLVIMAWYGVNFILGAGLHSYGFGSGGAGYAAGLLCLHLLLLAAAWIVRKKRSAPLS